MWSGRASLAKRLQECACCDPCVFHLPGVWDIRQDPRLYELATKLRSGQSIQKLPGQGEDEFLHWDMNPFLAARSAESVESSWSNRPDPVLPEAVPELPEAAACLHRQDAERPPVDLHARDQGRQDRAAPRAVASRSRVHSAAAWPAPAWSASTHSEAERDARGPRTTRQEAGPKARAHSTALSNIPARISS